jgi:adenine-specific DNA-methyltransferase
MTATAFDRAFEKVQERVEVFRQGQQHFLSPSYNETAARQEFIDKFWTALGWDVTHETQTNPYEQEVKVERSGTGSERRRRADYAFLAPNFRDVRFYVEAKKPSVELANREHYFQTIRYGWNGHTPLAVLTDFEQFHILDCRYKPDLDTSRTRKVSLHGLCQPGEIRQNLLALFARGCNQRLH